MTTKKKEPPPRLLGYEWHRVRRLNEDPRLRKALDAWAQWYSRKLDAIAREGISAGSYSGSEQDLFEALGCEVPEECTAGHSFGEADRLRSALGRIAELGERCEECEPTEAPFATHVTAGPMTGIPTFLCGACAETTRQAYRKAESKGCGKQPDVEEHEQDTAVQIALKALGSEGDGGER